MEKTVDDKCHHNNILVEPLARNTSAAIGFAAINIMKKYGFSAYDFGYNMVKQAPPSRKLRE